MYLVFTRMPGESYRSRRRSLLLCLCDVVSALIINNDNSNGYPHRPISAYTYFSDSVRARAYTHTHTHTHTHTLVSQGNGPEERCEQWATRPNCAVNGKRPGWIPFACDTSSTAFTSPLLRPLSASHVYCTVNSLRFVCLSLIIFILFFAFFGGFFFFFLCVCGFFVVVFVWRCFSDNYQ